MLVHRQWHIICFMQPSGCFLVIEMEEIKELPKFFGLHI